MALLRQRYGKKKTEKSGQTTLQSTISIQKSYKDEKTGEWVNCKLSLFPSEIPQLISVAQEAYNECTLKRTV
jgi:hypothetical protein